MLKYNFDRLFKTKGITKPFSYLKQAGFSASFATKIRNNRVNTLTLDIMEQLCLKLACTPNDLFDWAPNQGQDLEQSHPLFELQRRKDKIEDLYKTLNELPFAKLEEVQRLIRKKDNTSDAKV